MIKDFTIPNVENLKNDKKLLACYFNKYSEHLFIVDDQLKSLILQEQDNALYALNGRRKMLQDQLNGNIKPTNISSNINFALDKYLFKVFLFLSNEYDKLSKYLHKMKLELIQKEIDLLDDLISIMMSIKSSGELISLKLSRISNCKYSSEVSLDDRKRFKRRVLKKKIYHLFTQVELERNIFMSCHIEMIDDVLTSAIKANQSTDRAYFPEHKHEDILLEFFTKINASPLIFNKLIPFRHDFSSGDSVKQWILDAAESVATYINTKDAKKISCLKIMMERLFFKLYYPKCFRDNKFDVNIAKRFNDHCHKTPKECDIRECYIPSEYYDKPSHCLFNNEPLATEALGFINSIEFHVAPIDCAHCVLSAYEKLIKLCQEQLTKTNQQVVLVFGFDDYFDLWLLMLSCSYTNFAGLADFISKYSPNLDHSLYQVSLTYIHSAYTFFSIENQ